MSTSKLNQIIAVASSKKSAAKSAMEQAYKLLQKDGLFLGQNKTYRPKAEDGERLPNESRRVEHRVPDVLDSIKESWTNMLDVVMTNDAGNADAKADVVVNGNVLLSDVPVTTLIFLEKQLTDINTLVAKIPTLSESYEWSRDESARLYRTVAQTTHRTKKVHKPIVLHAPTEEHPAQTQLVVEDELVGFWDSTNTSGALSQKDVRALAARVSDLKEAIVKARELANSIEVKNKKIGATVFDYLFKTIVS